VDDSVANAGVWRNQVNWNFLPVSATGMSYLLVLLECLTCWCYRNVLPVGATGMSYLLVLQECLTCWCYWNVLPVGATGMSYLLVLLLVDFPDFDCAPCVKINKQITF